MSVPEGSLKEELQFFDEKKLELLKTNAGQFALIRHRELVGTFTTFDEAYAEGVGRFGNSPMLIRQIVADEPTAQAPALMHGMLTTRA